MNWDFKASLGIVAGIISVAGFVPYIAAVLSKQTRPNRATWWIWTVVGGVLFGGYVASGNWSSAWVPLSYTVGPLIVSILSIKRGEGGWEPFDRKCLAASLIGLVLWGVSGAPLFAMVINMGVDFAGALPTIRKTYRNPQSEDKTAWTIFLISNGLNCFAVTSWKEPSVMLPVYYFAMTAVITVLCFRRISSR